MAGSQSVFTGLEAGSYAWEIFRELGSVSWTESREESEHKRLPFATEQSSNRSIIEPCHNGEVQKLSRSA